jgi:hypothetical protein
MSDIRGLDHCKFDVVLLLFRPQTLPKERSFTYKGAGHVLHRQTRSRTRLRPHKLQCHPPGDSPVPPHRRSVSPWCYLW